MVRHLVLLLLALGVLAGELLPRTEAQATSYGVKLCGREFIRAVIFTCGGSRWRRALDTVEDAFPEVDTDSESELDEAVASSEWPALTKSPQAFYGAGQGRQGTSGSLRGRRDVLAGLSSSCCKRGCSKSQIGRLC